MEEQSEIVRSKKEFAFASSTILSQVGRGIIVGLIVGIIVGSFRFLIEKGFHMIQGVYQDQGYLVRNLFVLVLFYILICWLSAKLTRSEKDIKGSGIPQVEAELKGLMSLNWWGILWKKYVLGIFLLLPVDSCWVERDPVFNLEQLVVKELPSGSNPVQ